MEIKLNQITKVKSGDLLYSATSKKLYIISEVEYQNYDLINLTNGKCEYMALKDKDIINLTKELIYIKNKECRIEINY